MSVVYDVGSECVQRPIGIIIREGESEQAPHY